MRAASPWLLALPLAAVLALGSATSTLVAFAQDRKPARKAEAGDDATAGRPESQLKRAWTTAVHLPPNRTPDRVTVLPGQGADEQDNVIAVFEYTSTGDLGIFYGGPDATSDRYVLLDKVQRADLEDILLHPRKAR